MLPFRNEGTNGVPDDLRGRITDAFIDSLALIEGVRRSPRKSGWVHHDEDLLRRSLAESNDMRHILTGRISSLEIAWNSRYVFTKEGRISRRGRRASREQRTSWLPWNDAR